MQNPPTLEVKRLLKSFSNVKAVRGVDFQVKRGTCFGLLGPNGAGKSTTLEMIEGILKPDGGEILYQGKPIGQNYRQELGVQFQETALLQKLTIREALTIFQKFYQRSRPIAELIELCQLEKFQDQMHENVSGGQRQRLLLAIALCNDPEILLLDEPTTGLDPQARRHLWEIIRNIKAKGKTIILTTHYMDEAEELCDVIGIIDQGKIIALGNPSELLKKHCPHAIIEIHGTSVDQSVYKDLPHISNVVVKNGKLELQTKNLQTALTSLSSRNVNLENVNIRKSNLEDLFILLTGHSLRT